MMNYGTIYSLTLFDGRTYVGQTTLDPYSYYKQMYVRGKGVGRPKIHNAIKKYGISKFNFRIIDNASTKEELDSKEIFWMNLYGCNEFGFNIKEGGSNGKHSEETKKKISEVQKGKIISKETRTKISKSLLGEKNFNYGKPKPDHVRIKHSLPIISEDGSLFFISQADANKQGYTHARSVAHGDRKKCHGIVFRFATQEEIEKFTGVCK